MRIGKEPLPLPGTVENPLYPSSDGGPMGETDFHSAAVLVLGQALQDFYAAGRTDVLGASTRAHQSFGVTCPGENACPASRLRISSHPAGIHRDRLPCG